MQTIQQKCKNLVTNQGVNLQSSIEYEVNGDIHTLTIESIIESYMQEEK